jgi:ubiquinone/menaquinone biosynthesis C-methylase UbiE
MIERVELRDDSTVLDVAAGTGEPGLTAAASVPRGSVTVTDLSELMLAGAADNAARRGIHNFETRQADAGALPFADATFDAVLCRFGFMFFPDVHAAAREFARVVRPGRRACAAVWASPDKNPWATTIMGTIAQHVQLPAPAPDAPGLFRCAAPGYMRQVFERAGFRDVAEEEVESDLVQDSAEDYWTFMTEVAAPVVAGLSAADAPTRDRIREAVLARAAEGSRDGAVRFRATASLVTGTR